MGLSFSSASNRHRLRVIREAVSRGDLDPVRITLHEIKKQENSTNQRRIRIVNLLKGSPLLHLAAHNGDLNVLTVLLELGLNPNSADGAGRQTPLMFACKKGHVECVEQLLKHDANPLAFDSKGRTCLHMACRGGHLNCVVKILNTARNGSISRTWGYERFVNVRDDDGAIPLHLAARSGNAQIVRLLLNSGALVSAVTSKSTYGPGHGSTPLHCAARSGSLECIEELLAWGADRTYKDLMGETPYTISLQRGDRANAAILNPNALEPIVWPSPLKLMRDLEPETRSILQAALTQASQTRRKQAASTLPPQIRSKPFRHSNLILQADKAMKRKKKHPRRSSAAVSAIATSSEHSPVSSPASPVKEENAVMQNNAMTCWICFESFENMIQIDDCGHQMCASCTMALCCHSKPNPNFCGSPLNSVNAPSCPFCRRDIGRLTLAKSPLHSNQGTRSESEENDDEELGFIRVNRSRRHQRSSSFRL